MLTFESLVEEIKDLHRILGTNPRWAEMDADAFWSGEQSVFLWQKADSSFATVTLVIRDGKLRSQVKGA